MTLTALMSAVVSSVLLTSPPTGQINDFGVVDDALSAKIDAAAAPLPEEALAVEGRTVEQLSARQIDQYLTRSNLPENCWVEYLGGTLICAGVICDINGVWVPFECDEFGL